MKLLADLVSPDLLLMYVDDDDYGSAVDDGGWLLARVGASDNDDES